LETKGFLWTKLGQSLNKFKGYLKKKLQHRQIMEAWILVSFGIINMISLNVLNNQVKWINTLNIVIYSLSCLGTVLVESDKYNNIVLLGFLTFKMISIVWGIIIGVAIIANPEFFINCTSVNKYECSFTKSVFPEFVGAVYVGNSLLSIYFWNSIYSFRRLLLKKDLCPA